MARQPFMTRHIGSPRSSVLPAWLKPLLPVFGFLFVAVAVFAASVTFDIPAQPAPAALQLFIKQSGAKVMFNSDELKNVQTKEVKGEMEPADAMKKLLENTGYESVQTAAKHFVIKKATAPVTVGSLRGSLTGEGGIGLKDVLVSIPETGQSVSTDRNGVFGFPDVPAGTYMLVAKASGYQTMHITDVTVRAGRELTVGKEEMRKTREGVMALDPVEVRADTVTELEKFEVYGSKVKPFSTANVDIQRTRDDTQPYYIFDAKTIDQSGAVNIAEFLKQRLTMNTVALSNGQGSGNPAYAGSPHGNVSLVNLRGLGANETLILVNGRRMAAVSIEGDSFQPDLNGIPLTAIDRIEVLPSSASGIYGGSAVGGVINIILKKNYVGGGLVVQYDNVTSGDAPTRSITANYGMTLEGGKTHVLLSTSWSDAKPMLFRDRATILAHTIATINQNSPNYFYGPTTPFLGSVPNIVSRSSLVFKDGTPLGSNVTHISPGTSANTPPLDLKASLLANAGKYDFTFPTTAQDPTGLLRPLVATPETKSFLASVRRQMLPNVELFADFSYSANQSTTVYSPLNTVVVQPNAASNPFTSRVVVDVPNATSLPVTTNSANRGGTLGVIVQLPADWVSELDYTYSQNRFHYSYYDLDQSAIFGDVATGTLNPFVDTLRYPLTLEKYLIPHVFNGSSALHDFALRASGHLPSLPAGAPTLTAGLEHRISKTPENSSSTVYPLSPENDVTILYYAQNAVTDSAYAEASVPLFKPTWLPLVHALELQLSGRKERYTVDNGTTSVSTYPNTSPPGTFYSGPTLNGRPYFANASYSSLNYTAGIKYQPTPDLTLRVSRATAFLPPSPNQLVRSPQTDNQLGYGLTTVTDPRTGISVDTDTISGGNPNLKPQNSKSTNVGIIWEPRWKALQGLRLNVEYYKIAQFDSITNLGAQAIVDQENLFPGRVTRDSAGNIVLVDASAVNLYKLETEGWDFSADYSIKTDVGTFSLHAAESIILHLKTQYSQTDPEYDAVNFPSEGGAAKFKTNATATWDWRNWTVSWTSRYFGSYKQYGTLNGPYATQYGVTTVYSTAQGSDSVASQIYHDVFVGYAFGKQQRAKTKLRALTASILNDLTLQVGVRNVFNKIPPLDAYPNWGNYYLSPYGDMRLRSYWLSVRKDF